MNETPKSMRRHIGIAGNCNAGKSALINALTGQPAAIVSAQPGTTTDPVEKAAELLPVGPVLYYDTAGLDDRSPLGIERITQAKKAFARCELLLYVVDSTAGLDERQLDFLNQLSIPHILVWNKCDHPDSRTPAAGAVCVSAKTGAGIEQLQNRMIALLQQSLPAQPALFGKLLKNGDFVILVTPIDAAAPKGRLILPQVRAAREILDAHACPLMTQPQQLPQLLRALPCPPRLVVTDSQAFSTVNALVPADIPLTSFSILFARIGHMLNGAGAAAQQLFSLPERAQILIAEGCSHKRQCGDIATVKLPKLIEQKTGRHFNFTHTAGHGFPDDLSPYALIIHCGGCMLGTSELQSRFKAAAALGIPMTNFGITIAALHGILSRSEGILAEIERSEA